MKRNVRSIIASGEVDNLVDMFFHQARRFGDKPFVWSKQKGQYTPMTWRQVAGEVNAFAHGLISTGVKRGDRVVVVSENRAEWLISDMAIMSAGAITVPAYTTNTVKDHIHIFQDCGASCIIVSNSRLARTVMSACAAMDPSPMVVVMDRSDVHQNPGLNLMLWEDVLANGAGLALSGPPPAVRNIQGDDIACLIYTSGTGGAPKGVMLSHRSIMHNCLGGYHVLRKLDLGDEVFLSFLPLSHAYEHTVGQFIPISLGSQIYYAEGIDQLASNLLEARPTIVPSVPRLFEVLQQKITKGIRRKGGSAQRWFDRTLNLGLKRINGERLCLRERAMDMLCSALVRRKIASRFGGRLKAFVSGGAPLHADVWAFFMALGVRLLQGYGQTEAAPVITVTLPGGERLGSVGPPLHEVEIKIASDGEICVRGPLVMHGYWNNPAATAAVLDEEGWLHTGDIGRYDDDGNLVITDRKKDIIVNSGGDNIAPQRVEGVLTMEPIIAQAMVWGDKRPHLAALIVPDVELVNSWAKRTGRNKPLAELADDKELRKMVQEAIARVNRSLSPVERIRRFALVHEPFTIENGMLTPTLKIRRHAIHGAYGDVLEGLYVSDR